MFHDRARIHVAAGRGGRKLAGARAAEEQDLRVERLALLPVQPLDEEALALVDDVLLPSEADDRVVLGHGSQKRGPFAREREF